jgi:hypothetical protein
MDLVTASTSFASLVGLITQFAEQRRDASGRSYEEFKAWLAEHRHEEVIKLLEQNGSSIIAIRAVLSQDRKELLERLANMDRSLASLAYGAGFEELAAAVVRPGARVSDQAIAFLRSFEKSGSGRALEVITMQGRDLVPMDRTPGVARAGIEYGDWRFFEDDMATLIEIGLLRLTYNSQNKRVFVLTRRAVDFIRELDNRSSEQTSA